jgi:cytochrome c
MQSRSIAPALALPLVLVAAQVAVLPAGASAQASMQPAEATGGNSGTPSTRASSVQRGRELLAQYQCGACHTIEGVPAARGQTAQAVTAWSRRSYIAGRLPNRPDVLAQWITAPHTLVPGTNMPSMGVSPADAQAMAAYLFSLK